MRSTLVRAWLGESGPAFRSAGRGIRPRSASSVSRAVRFDQSTGSWVRPLVGLTTRSSIRRVDAAAEGRPTRSDGARSGHREPPGQPVPTPKRLVHERPGRRNRAARWPTPRPLDRLAVRSAPASWRPNIRSRRRRSPGGYWSIRRRPRDWGAPIGRGIRRRHGERFRRGQRSTAPTPWSRCRPRRVEQAVRERRSGEPRVGDRQVDWRGQSCGWRNSWDPRPARGTEDTMI